MFITGNNNTTIYQAIMQLIIKFSIKQLGMENTFIIIYITHITCKTLNTPRWEG